MLAKAVTLTTEYANHTLLANRKYLGQFFTCETTAVFMAALLHTQKPSVRVLDPGAGSGILSIALVTKLVKQKSVKEIFLDLYEIDESILTVLYVNLETLKKFCEDNGVQLHFCVKKDNYILHNQNDWESNSTEGLYDLVICNPPYKKISASAPEAVIMRSVIYGQPNLYFLFMAMSLKQLVPDGELTFIIPRSWASGAYFRKFREFLFQYGDIRQIHIFKSRNKVFQNEDVLQETIIIHARKGKQSNTINISESDTSSKFFDFTKITVPQKACISPSKTLFLPSSQIEMEILKKINALPNSLKKMGLLTRTGKVVDFRNKELLKKEQDEATVPLLWASNFIGGRITHPFGKEVQFIANRNRSLLMKNGDYVFIKRFSAKEEARRLQSAIYLHELNSEYIAAENHLNYIDCTELNENTIWGLYAILSSSLWDSYIRLFNGSTQVNAGDINELPLPSEEKIDKIGRLFLQDKARLDKIIEEIIQ